MHKVAFATLAALVALAAPAHAANQITVENIGSVFNQSLPLPAESTPGSSIGFEQFFEFSLPTTEQVTLSVSDSGFGTLRIVGGELSLNFFTSSAPTSPFQPIGATIDSAALVNVPGGQSAELGPDVLLAGNYFAEVSGVSGSSPIHLAIDGTVTALSTPEPATWAMMAIGFGLMGLVGVRSRKGSRLSLLA
jgi:PEP-CTERM motif